MLKPRLIVCLDVADGFVVKGRQFERLQRWGRPEDLARRYQDEGADEVVVLDITASPEQRGPDVEMVGRVARDLAIPLTVGGGLSRREQVGAVLAAGADKVSLNTAALADPALVAESAGRYGSQAVVVAVDVRREDGDWRVYSRGGRVETPWRLRPWLERVEALGAGEILLTSIDQDGTGTGYDRQALAAATQAVSLPVIASGGAQHPDHLAQALAIAGVTGVLVAGVLHRGETTIGRLKQELAARGVMMREQWV